MFSLVNKLWTKCKILGNVLKKKYHLLNFGIFSGHFLGVDHAGHKYGPSHYEMRRKLSEMNLVIEKIVKNLPQDCVLFVMVSVINNCMIFFI